MQAKDFQDTAERLVQEVTEADWRSGMSRGYYAVFHHFQEFFLTHGLNLGRAAVVHSNLYLGLLNLGSSGSLGLPVSWTICARAAPGPTTT